MRNVTKNPPVEPSEPDMCVGAAISQLPLFLLYESMYLGFFFCLFLMGLVLANNIFLENYPLRQGFQISLYQFEETCLPGYFRLLSERRPYSLKEEKHTTEVS